ncbi:hypothetical protein L1987_14310 [Smallanthus sonchifolius]|uniref:Uncharacterized protein n=1 Tax=Smallanthus sonchifolius TaxID=185202 RepID=A0ACB9J3G7_9ASTR|nr:hypothetical protein L1987_14310 [Smallanthus sonchifolius]
MVFKSPSSPNKTSDSNSPFPKTISKLECNKKERLNEGRSIPVVCDPEQVRKKPDCRRLRENPSLVDRNREEKNKFCLDEIKRGYKLNSDTTAHDGDGSSQRDSNASENKKPKAIVNSNIQGINNSMMFNSSVTERNPGVHLGFYRDLSSINDSMMKNTDVS